MRQILPPPGDAPPGVAIDATAAVLAEVRERPDGDQRPWVYCNMVMSVDGAASVDGRSGGLGGDGDRLVFGALRASADVVLAGAETVRTERYHLAAAPDEAGATSRAQRGQGARPRLCVVTRQAELTGEPPLLGQLPEPGADAEPWQRPILATVTGARPDPRLDVIELGDDSVDLATLVLELGRRGMRRILCEGGPVLLGQLADLDLVDEWNFTIDPSVVGGDAPRPMHTDAARRRGLRLERLFVHDDSTLFARYLRS